VELHLLVFLTSLLYRGNYSDSRPGLITCKERTPWYLSAGRLGGLMTLSGGERNLVLFPASESRFFCDPVLVRTVSLTTLSLRETVIQNCGVDGESVVRMMVIETTFATSGLFLPQGFAQDVGPVIIPPACLTRTCNVEWFTPTYTEWSCKEDSSTELSQICSLMCQRRNVTKL